MEQYKILMEINRKQIFREKIPDIEKENTVSILLGGICCKEDILKYKRRMRVNAETDTMYPDYYIPPYNGNRKLRLVQGYLPKTNILYANHYELEIIRLLFLFAPENKQVIEMADNTLQRLKNTCFGNFCTQGECTAAGISVLRLLAVTKPDDLQWINTLLEPLGELFLSFGNRKASVQKGIPLSYLLMAYTDINNEKTRNLIAQKKDWLFDLLNGNCFNLMGKFIIRNAVSTLLEYEETGLLSAET